MQDCERCGARANGQYELFDYCAHCSANLCHDCMKKGCCKKVPADSGSEADDEETQIVRAAKKVRQDLDKGAS